MKKLKGVLIDAFDRVVRDLEIDDDLYGIYGALSCEKNTCSTFEIVHVRGLPDHMLLVDEEFLLKKPPLEDYFALPGVHCPIGGRAFLVGDGHDGTMVNSSSVAAGDVFHQVRFLRLRVKGWTDIQQSEAEHPVLGKVAHITMPQPIYEEVP